MNRFKVISVLLMLVSLVISSYYQNPEVDFTESLNSSINTTRFSLCIKPWKVNSPSPKNALSKENNNSNIILDINLPLDPIGEGGKYNSNISLDHGFLCQQNTLSSFKNRNKSPLIF